MDLPDRAVQAIVTGGIGLAAVVAVRFAAQRILHTYELRLAQRDPLEVARRRTIAAVLVRMTVALVAAIAMAVVASGDRLVAATVTLIAGIGYGILLRRLAARGWLPPPEE